MAGEVKVDSKIGLLALLIALGSGASAFYALQSRLAVMEAKAADLSTKIMKVDDDVTFQRREAMESREKMSKAVSELMITIVRMEGRVNSMYDKVDIIVKEKGK